MANGLTFVLFLIVADVFLSNQRGLQPKLNSVHPHTHGHHVWLKNPNARAHFLAKLKRLMSLPTMVPLSKTGLFPRAGLFQPALTLAGTSQFVGFPLISENIDLSELSLTNTNNDLGGFPEINGNSQLSGFPQTNANSGINGFTNRNSDFSVSLLDSSQSIGDSNTLNGIFTDSRSISDTGFNYNVNSLGTDSGVAAVSNPSNMGFVDNSGTSPSITSSRQELLQRLSSDLFSIVNSVPNVASVTVGSHRSDFKPRPEQRVVEVGSNNYAIAKDAINNGVVHDTNVGNNGALHADSTVLGPDGLKGRPGIDGEMHNVTSITQSSIDGVQLIQTPLSNGGSLTELVLAKNSVNNKIDSVFMQTGSDGNPFQGSLKPVQKVVNVNIDNVEITPLAFDKRDKGVALFDAVQTPITTFNGIFNEASPGDNVGGVPVSQVLIKDTSFLTAHGQMPLDGKILDPVDLAQSLTTDIVSQGSDPLNTSSIQTVITGLGKSGNKQTSDVQVDAYNPFSTRLKPEAFGPGPYYECSPPARVVCGARIGWDHVIGMTDWCKKNCVVFNYSSYCDDDRCVCDCVNSNNNP